eukprot:TRINITY_DN5708_c0_g1_i1.p1 TRINITY_DN5708_c0_g1~~TRINITY_DN5708_c0_g1_i1.p1  ORF type:complete len:207 (-),score=7.26 TRINITY_DN5708_c0_g1_i1:80-700(-)
MAKRGIEDSLAQVRELKKAARITHLVESASTKQRLALPPHCWIQILTFLDAASLLRSQRVCKLFFELASAESMWLRHCQNQGIHFYKRPNETFKHCYSRWDFSWMFGMKYWMNGAPANCSIAALGNFTPEFALRFDPRAATPAPTEHHSARLQVTANCGSYFFIIPFQWNDTRIARLLHSDGKPTPYVLAHDSAIGCAFIQFLQQK